MDRAHLVSCVGMARLLSIRLQSCWKHRLSETCLFPGSPVHVHVSVCGSWVIVYANTASHSVTAP